MKTTMIKLFVLVLLLAVSACSTVNKLESQKNSESQSVIEIKTENYYPDGIAARKDGTRFVGSMWTGQIDMIPAGAAAPVSFVSPEAEGRTVLGLFVDENDSKLWAVFWDYQKFMNTQADRLKD